MIEVAIAGAPHGVRGELRVKSLTGVPSAFAGYGPLTGNNGQVYTVVAHRPVRDDLFVVRLKGVDDRDAAARLNGARFSVPRTALPPAEEDEFYHADLIGLDGVEEGGAALGQVLRIDNFGAGDILVLATSQGEALVPFTRACVPHIDLAARRVTIVLPDEVEAQSLAEGGA